MCWDVLLSVSLGLCWERERCKKDSPLDELELECEVRRKILELCRCCCWRGEVVLKKLMDIDNWKAGGVGVGHVDQVVAMTYPTI
jgi:hypothetical protein